MKPGSGIIQEGDFSQLPPPGDLLQAGQAAKTPAPAAAAPTTASAYTNAEKEDMAKKRDPLLGKKKNLLSYVVFLVVFVNASFNGRTGDMYYQNHFVETVLSLRKPIDANATAFDMIERVDGMWDFLERSFSPGIHDADWAGNRPGGAPARLVSRPLCCYLNHAACCHVQGHRCSW